MSIKGERDKTFNILSVIGILLVILSHIDFNIVSFGDVFPYYSYQIAIFVFISGYFYRAEDEEHIGKYVKRKFLKLLVPYFILNTVYGVIVTILRHNGFEWGADISLYNLTVAPFLGGHQFMLNATTWFVPALFMLEICNIIARKVLNTIKIKNEYAILALYLLAGIIVVWLAKRGSIYDWRKTPGRLIFMAPVFQMGYVYKTKLQKLDKLPSVLYFSILIIINLILVTTQGGLGFSVVWVTGFSNSSVMPYITTVTGIALWLRISRILAKTIGDNWLIKYMGTHTFSIMFHHLLAIFMVNSVLCLVHRGLGLFLDFDVLKFTTDVYYAYAPAGIEGFKLIYVMVGVALPLCMSYIYESIKKDRRIICGLQKIGKIIRFSTPQEEKN